MRALDHGIAKLSAATYALPKECPVKLWARLLLHNKEAIKAKGHTDAIGFKNYGKITKRNQY
jgi:hypothetical protein